MSTPDSQKNSDPPQPAAPSPLPGCIILITTLLVFGALGTWFTVVYHKQSRAIAAFTQENPVETPLFQPTETQIAAAGKKLDQLVAAAAAGETARLLFSAEDLNTLIATRELLADFRGQTHVRSIDDRGIEAEMTQPIRTGFLSRGVRYLHGTYRLIPGLAGGTVHFRVAAIEVPGHSVPEGFVRAYPAFMKIDPKLAPFDRVLPELAKVYIEGGAVVVETRSRISPEAENPKS